MEKIYIQRKVEIWVEDVYSVEEIDDDTIEQAINYDILPYESEALFDTQENLGPVLVYNAHRNLIKANTYE